ncbi:MAG: polysaccharide biosynthesis C-terminal domain-containing protein [Bacteroidetes bacterium]|nr:polysaccharide biosynthesis C-terminal domain-containing protein [Bacteroidota bacterium]
MLNKLLKSLSLLLLLNLLIKPIWVLLVDRKVQLVIDAQWSVDSSITPYGLFVAVYSYTLWFNVILDLGIRNYHNTTLAKNNNLLASAYSTYLPLKAILSFAYAGIMALAALIVGEYLAYHVLFWCLVLNQVLIGFTSFFRATITGLGRYNTDSIISVIDRVIMLALAVPIFFTQLWNSYQTIEAFVVLHTIAYAITTVVCLVVVLPHLKGLKLSPNFNNLGTTLKKTIPFALLTLLMTIYIRSDFVMIEQLLPNGAEKAGVYAKGYRILEAGTMFALLFGNLLLPAFSSIQTKKNELIQLIKSVAQLAMYPAIILSATAYLFREPLMQFYYPNCTIEVSDCFGLLMLNFISVSAFFIFSTALTAAHKMRTLNSIALGGLALNLILNFTLIPKIGIYGAIYATLATQGLASILQILAVSKLYSIKIQPLFIIKFIIWLIPIIGLGHLLSLLGIGWVVQLSLYMLINFTFAIFLRLVDTRQLILTLKHSRNDNIAD